MSLLKKFATVGGATLGSRVFGFVREMLMAAAVGTGPVADAFNAAFRFPNTFRRLFAEGAFNSAFVPLFAKEVDTDGMEGARRFSEEVFGVLFTVLLVLTIVMELSMPLLVETIIAPGFTSVPTRMMPLWSRFLSASSPTFGMSRVISSGPSLVSRAVTSNSWIWIEVKMSCLSTFSEMRMASSKL